MTDGIPPVSGQNTNISIEEFMRIFVDQLKYQDPLNPVDNKEFLSQIAQFTSLQIEQETLTEVKTLNTTMDWVNANQFIGRSIEARVGNGLVLGVVERVRAQGSGLVVDIKNADGEILTGIAMADVTSVGAADDVD